MPTFANFILFGLRRTALSWIETVDSEGNPIRIVTNRFDLDAEEIGEIYRSRWKIELFFKWLKQHVKIKTFYGTSDKAVHNQILIALIAYCLLLLIKMEIQTRHSLLQISRFLIILLCKDHREWMTHMLYQSQRTSRGRQKRRNLVDQSLCAVSV